MDLGKSFDTEQYVPRLERQHHLEENPFGGQ